VTTHRYRYGDQTIEGRFTVENVDGHVRPCISTEHGSVLANEKAIYDICGEPTLLWDGDLACTTTNGYLMESDPEPSMVSTVVNMPVYMLLDHQHGQG
jgi:hypothetical protein